METKETYLNNNFYFHKHTLYIAKFHDKRIFQVLTIQITIGRPNFVNFWISDIKCRFH